jgi:hypothetical protein
MVDASRSGCSIDHVRDIVPDDCARIRRPFQSLRRLNDIGEVELPAIARTEQRRSDRRSLAGGSRRRLAATDAPWLVERPSHHPEHLAERPVDAISQLAGPSGRPLEICQRVGIERLRRIDSS